MNSFWKQNKVICNSKKAVDYSSTAHQKKLENHFTLNALTKLYGFTIYSRTMYFSATSYTKTRTKTALPRLLLEDLQVPPSLRLAHNDTNARC